MNASRDTLLRPKHLIAGAIVATLGVAAIVAYALNRDARNIAPPTTATAHTHAQPARPALTAAEEHYIRALWPIHGDVERNATRMSLGQIFYKTQDMSRDELRVRVEEALANFQTAEKKLSALEPPASMRSDHDEYLSAVRLFKESAVEIRKMFPDGKDDYMLAAYPKSLEGSNKIRDIGGKLWPHEFPAH